MNEPNLFAGTLPGFYGFGRKRKPIWLLDDVLEELDRANKTPDDVRWVGSRDGNKALSWVEFVPIAAQYDIHDGLPLDLVVVGDDWWIDNNEEEGEQFWAYRTQPVRRPDAAPFTEMSYRQMSPISDDEEADN